MYLPVEVRYSLIGTDRYCTSYEYLLGGTSSWYLLPPVLTREFKAPDVPATPRDRPTFVRKKTSHGVGGGGGWAALWLDLT